MVSAFFDHLLPESRNGWAEREHILPLPSKEDGYAKVQLVGTTGAGKTTVVRQLLGTDPSKERFPSTSAAKTTVSDLEIIVGGDKFSAAVSFITREQARHYVMECISASVSAHLENNQPSEISRRFMEHAEQKFRLSYVLGSANPPKANVGDSGLDDEDDEEEKEAEADSVEVTHEERELFAQTFADSFSKLASWPQIRMSHS